MANPFLQQLNKFNVFLAGERERMELEEQKQKVSDVLSATLPLFDEAKTPLEVNEAFRQGMEEISEVGAFEALPYFTLAKDTKLAEQSETSRLKLMKDTAQYLGLPPELQTPEGVTAFVNSATFKSQMEKISTEISTEGGGRVQQDIVTTYGIDKDGKQVLKRVPLKGSKHLLPDERQFAPVTGGYAIYNKTKGVVDFQSTRTKQQENLDEMKMLELIRKQDVEQRQVVTEQGDLAQKQMDRISEETLGVIMGMDDGDDFTEFLSDRNIDLDKRGGATLAVQALLTSEEYGEEINANPAIQELLGAMETQRSIIDMVEGRMHGLLNQGSSNTLQPFKGF